MKIFIVSGSQRRESQSRKVAHFVASLLSSRHGAEHFIFELSGAPLPFWTDEDDLASIQDLAWKPVKAELDAADGIVIITPEWNGMSTPALKNFFLYCNKNELTDKPAYLVAVSSGQGGCYSASELRVSSGKDTQICYIPEQVIIRNVNEVLNESTPQSEHDAYDRARLDHGLGLLVQYSLALAQVRASGARNVEFFPYGM